VRAAALLLDLDNTLVPEFANYAAAFAIACAEAIRERGLGLAAVRDSVFAVARERWLASPEADYCARVGIGSPTSLLSDFPGDAPELAVLREWAPEYRRASWREGLHEASVADADALADPMSNAFRHRFREHCPPYLDVAPALAALAPNYLLGVATNGPADVQRIKLTVSGLRRFFRVVVASTDVGAGKPDRRIFDVAVDQLGVPAGDVVVIGDSLENDVGGATAAGLRCVWVNRLGAARTREFVPAAEIRSLTELAELLR
jgi:phosphoserine phosphatase